MRVPATIPAAAALLGTAAACYTGVPQVWPGVACAFAWGGAWAAYRRHRPSLFASAVSLAFLAGTWSLAVPGFREAEAPALRTALSDQLPSPSPLPLTGILRSDASRTANGIALDLELTHPGPQLRGGVRLTVAGALAGDHLDEWRAGRTLRVTASLREPGRSLDPGVADSRLDLARRGTVLLGGVKSGALVEVLRPASWAGERAADLRQFARSALARHVGCWSERSAAIVVAILIGDRAGLEEELQQKLREAGTYHVIAISGGNIAILAGLMFGFLRLVRVPTRPACWLVIAGLSAYSSLVGGGASVVRATLMAAAYLVAHQADHRSPPLNTLAVACALVLVVAPLALVDVGFALTFGATLGILVGAGLLSARVTPRGGLKWLRAPAALLFASISAELALFPVSAYAFSRVTFAGLLLNFVAIPLMSVAQIAGMVVLLVAPAAGSAASLAGWVAHLGAEGLVRSANLVDAAPWLSWRLPPPHPAVLVCYYGGWCAWLWLRPPSPLRGFGAASPPASALRGFGAARSRGARFRRALLPSSAALIVLSAVWILVEPVTLLFPGVSGKLRVTVLDVGHADAVLVQLPDRRSLLVDAGGSMTGGSFDIGGRVVAPALWALGTRRLDALVISHGDPDHAGGAAAVVRDFHPREIWEGIPVPKSVPMARLREQARAAGAAWRERRAGESVSLGDVTLRVLHPPVPDWERQKVRNDDSIVIELRYREVSVVLPGDIGREVERAIAPGWPPARLRVLKVPHHGSATSSTPEFLSALRPGVAIISAAATTKVTQEVLSRYSAVGAELFRTSDDGAVTVTTDGRQIEVTTFTGRRLSAGIGSTTKDTKNTKGE